MLEPGRELEPAISGVAHFYPLRKTFGNFGFCGCIGVDIMGLVGRRVLSKVLRPPRSVLTRFEFLIF